MSTSAISGPPTVPRKRAVPPGPTWPSPHSLSWNYAGEWEDELFDSYGVNPDLERVDFYRRRWNAGNVSSH